MYIGYANDVAILTRNEKDIRVLTRRLLDDVHKIGLQLNPDKCEIMILGGEQHDGRNEL